MTKSARSSVLHGQGYYISLTPSMKVCMNIFSFFYEKSFHHDKQSSPVQKLSYANMPTHSAKFIPWLLWRNHLFRHVCGCCRIQKARLFFKSFILADYSIANHWSAFLYRFIHTLTANPWSAFLNLFIHTLTANHWSAFFGKVYDKHAVGRFEKHITMDGCHLPLIKRQRLTTWRLSGLKP